MAERKPATPQRALSQTQDKVVFWLCAISSVSALLLWLMDDANGMTTAWDRVGVPVMGLTYGLACAALLWRPQQRNAIITTVLIPTSVYYLGGMYIAAQDLSTTGLYSMASNGQFMPLFYIGAFIALSKGAALISWLHYAGLVVLYVYQYVWPGTPGAPGPTGANPNEQIWITQLAAHPGYIVAMHYITALKGRLRASELESHQSKERFLAMLSHEIRTPLQAMLGSIDLLAIKAHSPPERRAIDRMRHAASQLDTHLRDVTEYTRLENPSWQLRTDQVDLAAMVRDVCEGYQPQAVTKGLRLHCLIPATDEPTLRAVTTDERRLRQVLSNLISNALKYTPQGEITVRACVDRHDASKVRLDVRDTGIGIPLAEQQRIFEPYVRLEDRRVADVEGSGLGLAVVKRLVDRLGGQLALRSQPEQGSCFSVNLPLQARQ